MHMTAYTTPDTAPTTTVGDVAPTRNAMLERARGDHRAAQADPRACRDARHDMKRTAEALRQADAAASSGAGEQEINHLATLVSRHAAIARATMDLRSAEAMVSAAAATLIQHQRALRIAAAQLLQHPVVVRQAASSEHSGDIRRIDTAREPVGFSGWLSRSAAATSLGSGA